MKCKVQNIQPEETEQDDVVTLTEACELLPSQPSYSTVLRWTKTGRLRSVYRYGRRLIAVDDLASFAERYQGQRLVRR